MVRAFLAIGSVAVIFFWRGYRAGNRNRRIFDAAGRVAVNRAELDAETTRLMEGIR